MRSGLDDYLVRAAEPGDLPTLLRLRELAGPGFTSLAIGDDLYAERLAASVRSFATPTAAPDESRYILVLEHRPSGEVVGTAQVKACIGRSTPFFNFRVLQIAQASHAAQRRFDLEVLILVNEFSGCAEVGSLFVRKDHRAGGAGRLLAQSRYMLIAAEPQRFGEEVVAELRGVVSPAGVSPFWEHLGRRFFRMDFAEADRLSATTDNQFILDLMPKYPIYVDLLPPEAQAVIGRCHDEGVGARKLLEREGFRFDRVVDIFDGGPLMSAPRDMIRTVREARRAPALAGAGDVAPGLAATPHVRAFRCVGAPVEARRDGAVRAPKAALETLGVAEGAEILAWEQP